MSKRKISLQAYDWAIRLQLGDIRERELEDYLDWIESHPLEAENVDELERLWDQISHLKITPPTSLQVHGDYRWSAISRTTEIVKSWLSQGANLAFLLLVMMVSSFVFIQLDKNDFGILYETDRAEMTTVNLADGSTANMNVLSTMRIDFSDNIRHVILSEGEVSFDVAPDRDRPFIVSVDDSEVYALGTEFNVKINPEQGLSVILLEGIIRVSTNLNADQDVATEILSEPGERARILPLPVLENRRSQLSLSSIEVSREEIESALSWRQERLIFEGQTLQEAIAEINRYTTHTIRLFDTVSGEEMAVYGVFNTGDWEGFVSAIESSFPLRGEQVRSDVTVLRPISRN